MRKTGWTFRRDRRGGPGYYLPEDLLARTVIDGTCLRWTGSHTADGYGRLGPKMVHRRLWELIVGPLTNKQELDHVKTRGCRFRDCINLEHLEVVDRPTNIARSEVGAVNRSKTHCPQGHPFDEANTRLSKTGQRICRECSRASWRRWYRKRRAA